MPATLPPDHWVHGAEGGGRNIGEACHFYDLFVRSTGSEGRIVTAKSLSCRRRPITSAATTISSRPSRFADGSLATLTYTALGSTNLPKERSDIFSDGKVCCRRLQAADVDGRQRPQIKAIGQVDKGHREELQALARRSAKGGAWPIPLGQQVAATRIAFAGRAPARLTRQAARRGDAGPMCGIAGIMCA